MDASFDPSSDELLKELRGDIQAGRIVVLGDPDCFFKEIERYFPVIGSKIAWSKVPGAISREINGQDYAASLLSFLDEIARATELVDSDQVVVVGDSAMDVALQMDIATLRKHLEEIVDMPQHTYIISRNARWCACYSMEGDMDFGYSPTG